RRPVLEGNICLFSTYHTAPLQQQVIKIPNTFVGMVFDPSGKTFFVGGGQDDNVHTYSYVSSQAAWEESGIPIALGHKGKTNSVTPTDVPPGTSGLAITPEGKTLLVTNLYNDSVSVIDVASRSVKSGLDLRPGILNPSMTGVPAGEYPFWITIKDGSKAYVSSLRDREIDVLNLSGTTLSLSGRIKVTGSPNRLVLNKSQSRLYVTEDFEDKIDIINTELDTVISSISTIGPDYITARLKPYRGSASNSLCLSPDEKYLYVTNGALNCVAVITLSSPDIGQVLGLLPTTFYPSCVSVSGDGKWLYVINEKNPAGPNHLEKINASNNYVYRLETSSLLSFPLPDATTIADLTRTVAANNYFTTLPDPSDEQVMSELRKRIKHVIYIVKENRTYDQVLGDLGQGNGDPYITQFGQSITPNYHKLATQFVNLDNFYTPGDVSGNGWQWSLAAREADYNIKSIILNYSGHGYAYDAEGTNRDVNIGYSTLQERIAANPSTQNDPNILPGHADVDAPDGPNNEEGTGYLWDAAVRKGLTIRDYGFYADQSRYGGATLPDEPYPYSKGLQVEFPSKALLLQNFDPYFWSFYTTIPDFYREFEWEREFNTFEKNNTFPTLNFVRLMEDHMGNFGKALNNLNTPEKQQSDNDYAVANLVDRIAHSRYKDDTLIFICEDDSQDGGDHVDAHRSTAYVVGPYVKHGALVSDHFTTVNLIRTIEDVLGLEHINLNTATARPMATCFDLNQTDWTFTSAPSLYLINGTTLPVPRPASTSREGGRSTHGGGYWAKVTARFDFNKEDNLKDPDAFNRIIWRGLKGDKPYPDKRTGGDLRSNRNQLVSQTAVSQ
ncbi:MAG: bifunctional YncE family protein/alkaline phosphatase family protein, partial [Verrucomicrobia bacterium]|nr:bifunctional YncE family protein/alkaline phosphatase family protein [Verrucomicrobiota bacterium]